MKIKILATGTAPDYYSFNGETITAHLNGVTETYDLTDFGESAIFQGASLINGVNAIRGVDRVNGELRVVLCQQVGPGHWTESDWLDSADYDPDAVHVELTPNKPFSGRAWARTREGKHYFDPFLIA